MNDLSANELKSFFEHLDSFEKELELKNLQDEFLDTYNIWMRTKELAYKDKINSLAIELMRIDPTFKFNFLE